MNSTLLYNYKSVVAYIQEIYDFQTFKNSETEIDFNIQKFLINNNEGIKIQCNMDDNEIKKFATQLTLHKVRNFLN